MTRRLAALDGPGQLNGAPEQQQLLGKSRLAGVRVRNDGEGATFRAFFVEVGHGDFGMGKEANYIGLRDPGRPEKRLDTALSRDE